MSSSRVLARLYLGTGGTTLTTTVSQSFAQAAPVGVGSLHVRAVSLK